MSILDPLNILILCDKPRENFSANTIVDHIDSFSLYSKHHIFEFSNSGAISDKIVLNKFDGIIIHYSLSIIFERFVASSAKEKIRNFSGLKILFVQDEYRVINKMITTIDYLGIDVLFTCFPEFEMHRIYTKEKLPNVSVYSNLTGYIPERLLLKQENPLPMAERPVDVGYRGRQLPFWYGALGFEKSYIADMWLSTTRDAGLKSDISYREQDRIYGEKWRGFIHSCKVMLGVESGASVMDFTGELEKQVDFYQLTHPYATFHDVQTLFLKDYEGQYALNQISPRCFEAIALKTGLVLFEGDYSHILKPHRHYIPLKKDFSNINAVIGAIRNHALLEEMVDHAYQEIACHPDYHYRGFIERVDAVMEREFLERNKIRVLNPYLKKSFLQIIPFAMPLRKRVFKEILFLYQRLPYHCRLVIKCVVRPKNILQFMKKGLYKIFS